MKQLLQQVPRKRQNLACRRLLVCRKKFSYWLCNKIIEKWSPKHFQLQRKKILTKWRLLFTIFYFHPTDLVNTKRTIPPQGRFIALEIYLDASRLGIYHHYSTCPLEDSCITFAFSLLQLSKYQLTIQQGGAQLWAQCTDTQADHALKVAIVPA